MTQIIGQGVTLLGTSGTDNDYTFLISGSVTSADVGKAVTQDTSAANTVKLAGDQDPIIGQLRVVEVRSNEGITVATVTMEGFVRLPVVSGQTVNVGDFVVGGTTAGSVYTRAPSVDTSGTGSPVIQAARLDPTNRVWEVQTGYVIVELR